MAVTTFAAIDIGSYEVSMKIFEMSKRIGFREINDVRYQLELGRGTYAAGRLEMETVDELCGILNDFKRMMAEFSVNGAKTALCALASAAACLLLPERGQCLLQILRTCGLFLAAYLPLLYLTGALVPNDRRWLRRTLSRGKGH